MNERKKYGKSFNIQEITFNFKIIIFIFFAKNIFY